ncbi:uncharacterized protein CTHT_0006500 [Thermochaetoides thermophila DSM 1495]|jgi:hypothetical protein|uniref:Uncharacterized protein n=1 Tax=Chaetomium thermophilum (strain DSM 1495 / CBS 144.50 / IMI 039719) TaxID=759272 RepID=G0RYF4_CHATD|nr:hypothetical protein CTHT_0006500 [Thermochaetoides thermophila DSM 1495]EGS23940.1 hypothetical protein CTHT_0006500 [Thermochaetoides thermophila DSM 1495]
MEDSRPEQVKIKDPRAESTEDQQVAVQQSSDQQNSIDKNVAYSLLLMLIALGARLLVITHNSSWLPSWALPLVTSTVAFYSTLAVLSITPIKSVLPSNGTPITVYRLISLFGEHVLPLLMWVVFFGWFAYKESWEVIILQALATRVAVAIVNTLVEAFGPQDQDKVAERVIEDEE